MKDHKHVKRSCREKITRATAQTEFNVTTAIKDDIKYFYKYLSKKRKTNENHYPSLDAQANI